MWRSLKKLKIELPYDPAIALLGVYPKDTDIVKSNKAIALLGVYSKDTDVVKSNKAIALPGVYSKDTDVVKSRAICTPMFRAALSTTAKLWKELRSPSTDDWIKKMWSI